MKPLTRRDDILNLLSNSDQPISAGALSEKFNVSRQVIVQDIAILRLNGYDILATNRGYMLHTQMVVKRVFKCRHTFDEMLDEGYAIIDLGGEVEDVFVNHRVYGRISKRLDLTTRTHVEELYRSLVSGASKPLMSVTDGYHYHTVSAPTEEVLNSIEQTLRDRGWLVET
jgi:hypothetical protein